MTRAGHPERLIEHAVRGMLPKRTVSEVSCSEACTYAGTSQPHEHSNQRLLNSDLYFHGDNQYHRSQKKTSIARVYVQPGKGTIVKRPRTESYFQSNPANPRLSRRLTLAKAEGSYDITANVEGGGIKGQVRPFASGIARALVNISDEHRALRKEGLLTRDSRMVERKKPGRRKARRRFQFQQTLTD